MQLTLKNGIVVKLSWNWLVIERIESTVGSIQNLTKKKMKERGETTTMGDIAYSIVQTALDQEYERDELLSLIEFKDMERIMSFMYENNQKTDDFTKKKTYKQKNNRKK